MDIKIRQLRAFDAIVRLGSFTEAARVLHVTPAALSLAIRELEARLGFSVLERTTRSLRLTEPGRGYLPLAQRVLTELEDSDRYAEAVQLGHQVIRVATTQVVMGTLLAAVWPALQAKWPNVRIHPLDVATVDIPHALVSRQADLAIGVGLPSDDLFEVRPFFLSYWHAYLSQGDPFFRREKLSWAELGSRRLYLSKSSLARLQLVLGDQVQCPDVNDNLTTLAGLAMAAGGQGVAVFPGYAKPF
ncbi:MAG TPA: LysR family transcriptional regulator, partial [Ramlibacter sp.]|nr:LysR family transcriptional regulator [Ramlibacter sp.]